MKLKLQLNKNILKTCAVVGMSLLGYGVANAQTSVTIDAGAEWVGAMNVYENNAEQTYLWYSDWGLADVMSELDTEGNTVTLYPNYNTYDPEDEYWSNGEEGNKIMQGITMVISDELAGQDFTFSGEVESYTLSSEYQAMAFVKVFNADYSATLQEITSPITTTGNFTITSSASQYEGGAHVQYGFMVTGINANPADMATNGNIVITDGEPSDGGGEPVSVTADSTSELVAYANWFELDGTTYVDGSVWALEDLKTVVNTENNTLILHPNFSAYGDGTDPYWADGENGAKVFEGNTYVEDNTLIGQTVTFTGNAISNTLADGYDGIAFIKVLSADYQLLEFLSAPLIGGEDFSLTSETASIAGAAIFQYGYSVTGVNANPTQETELGNAVVTSENLSTSKFTTTQAVVYPNPAHTILNIRTQESINNVAIYNIYGQKVMEAKTSTVDVSSLSNGIYIINIISDSKESTLRFVKQ